MNMKIELTASDIVAIIAEKYGVSPDDVTVTTEEKCEGYGPMEHYSHVACATVNIKDTKELRRIALDQEKPKPLTVEELRDLADHGEEYGSPIWVEDLMCNELVACITDIYDNKVVAIWAVEQWFVENQYGVTWHAYRNKPVR